MFMTWNRIYAIFLSVKKKSYVAVKKVREFIDQQPDELQAEYLKIVEQLEKDGRLIEPFGKKLDHDLFEIRVRRGQQVRVIYFYSTDDLVIGVHGFVKKSQKTPPAEIKQARRVMVHVQRGEYEE
jgi:phage-related protein